MSLEFTVVGPKRRPKGLNCRYSKQAGGYVVSPSKLVKFEKLLADGWDACVVTGKLYPPYGKMDGE